MNARFPARYAGTCTDCGDRFNPGADIGYRDGELCCGPCLDGDNPEPRHAPVCPDCRLQLPAPRESSRPVTGCATVVGGVRCGHTEKWHRPRWTVNRFGVRVQYRRPCPGYTAPEGKR